MPSPTSLEALVLTILNLYHTCLCGEPRQVQAGILHVLNILAPDHAAIFVSKSPAPSTLDCRTPKKCLLDSIEASHPP